MQCHFPLAPVTPPHSPLHPFTPVFVTHRKSLFEDAKDFYDKETGVLEVPLEITVADQVTVTFFIHNAQFIKTF